MKNFKTFLNTLLVGIAIIYLSSCDNGGETTIQDPTVSLSGTDFTQTTFEPGEAIDLTLTFTTPQGVGGINWQFFDADNNAVGTKEINHPDTDPDLDGISSDDTQGSVDLSIPVPEGTEGEDLTLVFEVFDRSSANSATEVFSFNVDSGIEHYETVLLGGFTNPNNGSFYNAVEDLAYFYQEALNNNGKVDFLFYFANDPEYTIASPASDAAELSWTSQAQAGSPWPFTVENNTMFKSLGSGFNFDNTNTSTQLINSFPESGEELRRVTNLQVGSIVAFRLDESRGSRYGIFKVTAIGGSTGPERSITLEVKVQSNDNIE